MSDALNTVRYCRTGKRDCKRSQRRTKTRKLTVTIRRKGDVIYPIYKGRGWVRFGLRQPATEVGLADLKIDVQADAFITAKTVFAIEAFTIPPLKRRKGTSIVSNGLTVDLA